MNTNAKRTATSVARRGGSGSFAAGGGDASPINSRLDQGPAGPEIEAVMKKTWSREHGVWSGVKDRGMTARGWKTDPPGLEAEGRTLSEAFLRPKTMKIALGR